MFTSTYQKVTAGVMAVLLLAFGVLLWAVNERVVASETVASFYALKRNPEGFDEIRYYTGAEYQLIYQTELGIQEYQLVGDRLVALLHAPDSNDFLLVAHNLKSGSNQELELTGLVAKNLQKLDNNKVGLIATNQTEDAATAEIYQALMSVTLDNPTLSLEFYEVAGNKFDDLTNWYALPDGSVLVQDSLYSVSLIQKDQVLPIGRYQALNNLSATGQFLIASTEKSKILLNLQDLSVTDFADVPNYQNRCLETAVPVQNGLICLQYEFSQLDKQKLSQHLYYVTPEDEKLILELPESDGRVMDVIPATKRQVILELLPAGMGYNYDMYPNNPKLLGITSLLLDFNSGEHKNYAAFDFSW